jgi:long-chain acyl-CoA synthetase
MGITLNERFLEATEEHRKATAFLTKRDGEWMSFSFGWAREQVKKTAFGLASLGLERGTRVGILSENRPEWATTDFGAMAAGFLLVPLYTTLIPSQLAYILNDAQAKVVFVSTMAHLQTILSIRDLVPALEKVVVFYPQNLEEDEFVISLDSLKKLGGDRSDKEFAAMSLEVRPEDPVTFVYTSGTTGEPKGVVLTHDGFMAELDVVEPCVEGGEGDVTISFLPLSHILQRVVDTFSHLHGVTLAYAESMETLAENLKEVRPTHVVAVPRVWEKIHGKIQEGAHKAPPLKRRLFEWSLEVGRRYRQAEEKGTIPTGLSIRHSLADALVFKKIRAATGGSVRYYVSTGAPLAKELAEFFDAVGIRILEVWGMTELTGAATVSTPDAFLFGSVGKPGAGVELKFTEEGEICIRSRIVMREYWRKPEVTAETIDAEGWLHTGDVGHVDEAGFVHITDRIKELIVTAGGKNVAPQPLENALKTDPFVAQAMVIGDKRNFIGALIVPEEEVLGAWARDKGIAGNLRALCGHPEVRAHYERIVADRMDAFSRYEKVRKFELVSEEFTQEAGELTPTLKLKRRVLLSRYADLIDGMYAAV